MTHSTRMHRQTRRQEVKVIPEDAAVVAVGAAVVTREWWEPMVVWVPDFLQAIVLICTVVYVIFRAANEIRKFVRNRTGD